MSAAPKLLIVAPHAGSPLTSGSSTQISTVGRTSALNAPGVKFGSLLGFLKIGGRKKKSGLPWCAPSENDARGRPIGGFRLSLLQAQTNAAAPVARVKRTTRFMVQTLLRRTTVEKLRAGRVSDSTRAGASRKWCVV